MKVIRYLATWFDAGAPRFHAGEFYPVTEESQRHVLQGIAEEVDASDDAPKAQERADKAEAKADDAAAAAEKARAAAEAATAAEALSADAALADAPAAAAQGEGTDHAAA